MPETLDPALPDNVLRAAEEVLELAHRGDLKLATAESCTGGLLAALLTDVPGRSHVFERGFVVYSNDAKCDLLGIARDKVESWPRPKRTKARFTSFSGTTSQMVARPTRSRNRRRSGSAMPRVS